MEFVEFGLVKAKQMKQMEWLTRTKMRWRAIQLVLRKATLSFFNQLIDWRKERRPASSSNLRNGMKAILFDEWMKRMNQKNAANGMERCFLRQLNLFNWWVMGRRPLCRTTTSFRKQPLLHYGWLARSSLLVRQLTQPAIKCLSFFNKSNWMRNEGWRKEWMELSSLLRSRMEWWVEWLVVAWAAIQLIYLIEWSGPAQEWNERARSVSGPPKATSEMKTFWMKWK